MLQTGDAAKGLLEAFPGILELRPRPAPGITLLRPDGHVAFSTRQHGAAALKSVRALLGSVVD